MAQSLGSLYVELKANAADFIAGVGKASTSVKDLGKGVEEAFSRMGDVAAKALAPFGELGAVLGESLGAVGEAANFAAQNLSSVAAVIGPVGVLAGGAAAALLTVEAAAIGVAIHSAETTAKMYELAQATGVSIETLSGLSFVAKQVGIDQETLGKSLEKLSKSIAKAAAEPDGVVNGFTRLNIATKNADGSTRDAGAVFEDLADRFSHLKDGTEKTAVAIELFGRGGAALVPALNLGKEGVQNFLDTAKALGIVLDDEAGQAALKFTQSLNTVGAAGEGVSIQIEKALLPSLQVVTDALVDALKAPGSNISDFIGFLAEAVKYTIAFGDLVLGLFREIYDTLKFVLTEALVLIIGTGKAAYAAVHFDWTGIKKAAADALADAKAVTDQYISDSKKNWDDYSSFVSKLLADPAKDSKGKEPPKKDLAAAPAGPDKSANRILEQIDAIHRQTVEQIALAGATGQTTAAQRLNAAAAAADADISKLLAEANGQTGAEQTKLIAIIKAHTAAIKEDVAAKFVAEDATKLGQDLQKEADGYQAQINSIQKLIQAYAEGGDVLKNAAIDKQFEADTIKLQTLTDEYFLLVEKFGESAEGAVALKNAIVELSDKIDRNAEAAKQYASLQIDLEIAQQNRQFTEQALTLQRLSDAYLQGAEAVRELQVQQQLDSFAKSHPAANVEQLDAEAASLQKIADANLKVKTAQEAAAYSFEAQYNDAIDKLGRIRQALTDNGQNTLLVDAAIYDENDKIVKQYDAAALKVGTLSEKFQGFLNDIALSGKNLGESVFGDFTRYIDSLEDKLAEFTVTGKANFKELYTSLETGLTKSVISKGFSTLAGGLESTIFGGKISGGKRGDSTTNPLYVMPVDSSGNLLGGLFGNGGAGGDNFSAAENNFLDTGNTGSSSAISGLSSALTSTFSSIFSSLTSVLGSIASGVGKAFTGIAGIFGGFLATGGDVTPGKAYVVGENHPEFFLPKQAGTVAPSLMSSTTSPILVNNHFYGVTDHDSFKRSEPQMSAFFGRSIAGAQSRGVRG